MSAMVPLALTLLLVSAVLVTAAAIQAWKEARSPARKPALMGSALLGMGVGELAYSSAIASSSWFALALIGGLLYLCAGVLVFGAMRRATPSGT